MQKALTFFCALLLSAGCGKKKEIIFPQYKSISLSVYASGVVKSRGQYQVFSNAPGVIARLNISEGDMVASGQPLAVLTNTAANLNKYAQQLAAGYNALQNNQEKLQELQYNIDVARQKKDNDSALYQRQLNLWQQDIGTRNELEQKQLSAKNSAAAFSNALLQYQQMQKQLDYLAKQSAVNAQISSAQASDLVVTSNVAGKVYSVLKKQGEMVTAQTPLAVIGEDGQYYLELQVDEYDIAKVSTGQHIELAMDSYKGQVFQASVSKIYPMMNEKSKTFTIEAVFEKQPLKVYPNLTAEANIVVTSKQRALLIPRNCLVDDTYVVLQNGEKRKVQTGLKDYQQAEIISGITDKDGIIKPKE